jgi:mannitol/fructose-specific phosphotransferase system IIA component (Ntr-type)
MPVRLSKLLDPARITLTLQSSKRIAALNEVAKLLENHPDVPNFAGFYQELLARDRLDTTSLGNQVALPHARTEHVKKIVVAVGRCDAGIAYEDNQQPVRLLFVLGTPKSNPGDYLMLVGSLCRLIKDAASREALFTAPTPEAFIETVKNLELQIFGPEK